MTMRPMMLEVIFATARAGSGDSAAAIVTTSAPIMDQMTVVTAARTENGPCGANPPKATRLENVGPVGDLKPQYIRADHDDEGDDGRDFDRGEPELKLAVGAGGHEIHAGHQRHQDSPDHPRIVGQPTLDDGRTGHGLHGDHHDPEIPIEPADGKAGPIAQARAGEFSERAHLGHLHRHLAQHAHDQQTRVPVSR